MGLSYQYRLRNHNQLSGSPSRPELDKDTRLILENFKWTQTKGPNGREASRGQEDILIDITVPAGRDTQTCGLRVLQYHAIIGNAFATRPKILREGEETLQAYIKETVFPQIQQVNIETTETYYNEMRSHLQQTEWMALLRTHPTWPDILPAQNSHDQQEGKQPHW